MTTSRTHLRRLRHAARQPRCLYCDRARESHGPDTGHEYRPGNYLEFGQPDGRTPKRRPGDER